MLSREAVVHKMFRASSLWFCPHILFNSASPYLRPLWYLSARPWRHWQTLITPASLPGPSTHAPSVQQPWPELKKSSWSMLPVNPCSALSWFSEWYFCRDACPALQKAFSLALCRVLSLLFLLGFPGGTLDLTDHLTRSLESRKDIETCLCTKMCEASAFKITWLTSNLFHWAVAVSVFCLTMAICCEQSCLAALEELSASQKRHHIRPIIPNLSRGDKMLLEPVLHFQSSTLWKTRVFSLVTCQADIFQQQ